MEIPLHNCLHLQRVQHGKHIQICVTSKPTRLIHIIRRYVSFIFLCQQFHVI